MPDLHFIFEIKCNLSFFQFDPINENHLRFMIARMSNNELFGTVNCHLNKISKSVRFNMAAIYNITVHIIVCNSATKISTVMEYCIYTILKNIKTQLQECNQRNQYLYAFATTYCHKIGKNKIYERMKTL